MEYDGESDYIYYNQKGEKIIPYNTQVSIDFPQKNQKKEKIELTQDMKNEKKQSDIDWYNYQNRNN